MAIPLITVNGASQPLYAPFSGTSLSPQTEKEDELLAQMFSDDSFSDDESMLFCYVEEVEEYVYVHPKLAEKYDVESKGLSPEELCSVIDASSGVAFKHDQDWSGVVWWGFAANGIC